MKKDYISENELESMRAGRTIEDIGKDIVDVLFTVHKHMGPGLNEAV